MEGTRLINNCMSSNQSVRTHGQYQQALTLEWALNPNNGQGCIEQCCTQNHLNFFLIGFWYFLAEIFGDFLLGMRLLFFFGWFVDALVTCHCRGTPAWHMSQPPGEWCCVACAKKDADQFCTFL